MDVERDGDRVPWGVMFRTLSRKQLIFDLVGAALLWLVSSPFSLFPTSMWTSQTESSISVVSLIVSILMAAGVALRRLSPALALSVVWAGAVLQMAGGLPPLVVNVAIFGVLYAVAAYGGNVARRAGLISVFVGSTLIIAYLLGGPIITGAANYEGVTSVDALMRMAVATGVGWLAAVFGLGLSYTLGILKRVRLRAVETEKEASVAQALAIAEQERVRIARDMHDVVAHSLAVVIAQADGARYAAAAKPELAAEALQTISNTARSALTDVRLLLTQLRHSQAAGPQPTLADLEELYAQVRAAGIDLRIDIAPAARSDPPGAIQLAVYRILQEALTNAIRHGDGSPVDVKIAWFDTVVDLEVRNVLSAGAVVKSGGHGLIGMRERASLVGGTLEAGEVGSNFVVTVSIPLAEDERSAGEK